MNSEISQTQQNEIVSVVNMVDHNTLTALTNNSTISGINLKMISAKVRSFKIPAPDEQIKNSWDNSKGIFVYKYFTWSK